MKKAIFIKSRTQSNIGRVVYAERLAIDHLPVGAIYEVDGNKFRRVAPLSTPMWLIESVNGSLLTTFPHGRLVRRLPTKEYTLRFLPDEDEVREFDARVLEHAP